MLCAAAFAVLLFFQSAFAYALGALTGKFPTRKEKAFLASAFC